ncbi:WGR domain-containing protein [Oceaniglobus trochenteri]|uniref:WGR domain-containing protein n=1 Tax=Oceaniglobus trochenteri TaxID=2763260 RepID=UPI001CFFA492|nr:WGR domain-containing protein [Oceaniglobus trochenteri]
MSVYMEKIEPETNCYRFYEIRIEPDLFAERSLVVSWGRIGQRGRMAVRGSGDRLSVECLAATICKTRLKRGYNAIPPC